MVRVNRRWSVKQTRPYWTQDGFYTCYITVHLVQKNKRVPFYCINKAIHKNRPTYPALLLTAVRSLVPFLIKPLIKFSGMPQSPNPPTSSVDPSVMPSNASSTFS